MVDRPGDTDDPLHPDIAALLELSPQKFASKLARMSQARLRDLLDWSRWAMAAQRPPDSDWRVWLVMAGRGFGKTRMGAEWVNYYAFRKPLARIALVGGSLAEARGVMVEGESGLLNCYGSEPLEWLPSLGRLHWPNGAMAQLFSAAEPDALRGFQHHAA